MTRLILFALMVAIAGGCTAGTVSFFLGRVMAPAAATAAPEPHPSVIVHTRDDRSIEGVQMLRDDWGILLGAAKLLNEGAEPDIALSGDVRIPLANVRMVQEAR